MKHSFTHSLVIGASALACWLLPNISMAAVEVDGLSYELDNAKNTAKVVAGEVPYAGDYVIPATIVYGDNTYKVTAIEDVAFLQCTEVTSLVIGDNVETVGFSSFERCYSLSNLVFGKKVDYLDSECFKDCKSLTNVVLPPCVRILLGQNFMRCENLISIEIGNSVEYIGHKTFMECALLSLTIPATITLMEDSILTGTDIAQIVVKAETPAKVTPAAFDGVNKDRCILWVPAGTVDTYAAAPYWKEFLKIQEIQPDWVYGYICDGVCYNLNLSDKTAEVVRARVSGEYAIPSSVDFEGEAYAVTSIGQYAFADCTELAVIEIPSTVNYIGKGAFAGCTGLQEMYNYAEEMPVIEADAFEGSNIENATLYVPEALVDSYKATAPWSSFKEIKPLTTTGISEISDANSQVEYYNVYGQKMGQGLQKGINIVKVGNQTKKVIVK